MAEKDETILTAEAGIAFEILLKMVGTAVAAVTDETVVTGKMAGCDR